MNNKILDDEDLIIFPKPIDNSTSVCAWTKEITLQLLYSAYLQGVFPWFNNDEPILWHNPDPRFCLQVEDFHVPKSIDRFLKHTPFTYTIDKNFPEVINQCSKVNRPGQNGTWIDNRIIDAYSEFFNAGYVHSIEAWHGKDLVGGFYGVLIGSVFCGESMFTLESNSAKSAFVLFTRAFIKSGGKLIDSQVYTDNIARYGAKNISRDAFRRLETLYLGKQLKFNITETFLQEQAIYNTNVL